MSRSIQRAEKSMVSLKRILCLLLSILILAACCGCGVKKVRVSAVTSGAAEQREADTHKISLPSEETLRMSNYMLSGRFIHEKKILYGSRHDAAGQPYLCRMKYTVGKNGMYVRETEPLDRAVDAQYLALDGEWLYYLRENLSDGTTAVCRVLSAEGASAEPQVLYNAPCDFLTLRNGRLYFTDAADHLLSMKADGTDVKTELGDKAVFYPYLLTDNLLLFQDDADGESLHMRYLPTGFELRISQGRVLSYIVKGSKLYFLRAAEGEGEKCRLCMTDLNEFLSGFDPLNRPDASFAFTTEEADGFMGPLFSINGDHINASNFRTEMLDNWKALSDNAWEKGFLGACQYVAKDYEIFYNYNSEGLVTGMLFYEPGLKRSGYIEIPG